MALPSLEGLGYPIFLGDSEGPWARGRAVNAAAAAAGRWDVALVSDSDTIPDPGAVRRAVAWVLDTGGAARPHDERWMLTKDGTVALVTRGQAALEPHHFGPQWAGGGLLVLTRDAWESVGGFDERYVEWGREDSALNLSLLRAGPWDRLPGQAWHLWHQPFSGKVKRQSDKLYGEALVANKDLIDAWAANKGLVNAKAVF
jgi:hypothetical protein